MDENFEFLLLFFKRCEPLPFLVTLPFPWPVTVFHTFLIEVIPTAQT